MVLFDPGLQPERTELAWRRTTLSVAVLSLIAMRVLPLAFGDVWWWMAGVIGLLAAGLLWLRSRARLRRIDAILIRHGDRTALPGGAILLALSALAFVIAVAGAAVVLVVAVTGA
jgi:hypothetical protein